MKSRVWSSAMTIITAPRSASRAVRRRSIRLYWHVAMVRQEFATATDRTRRAAALLVVALACGSENAVAQTSDAPPMPPAWSAHVSVATYVLPDDGNYVQPTLAADRDALHLEARYNYEDRRSVSGFVGW